MKIKPVPIIVPKLVECPFEKPYGYVYIYTNVHNGHRYIGKHKFLEPYIDLTYQGSGTHHWKNALKKYGWTSFSKEVLFWLELNPQLTEKDHNDILNEKERYFIDLLGTFDNPQDYNETPGGDGISGDLISGENNPMYGKSGHLNPMYGKRGELSPWWGKKHSQRTKDKISKALKGKEVSQETKDKISKANSGHSSSELQKQSVREANKHKVRENNPMWKGGHKIINKTHSDLMKDNWKNNPNYKNSIATQFNSENSSGKNNSQAKAVVQLTENYELVKEYSYLGEIKKLEPEFPSEEGVRKCCKGKQQKYKGYKWMYKTDYEQFLKEVQE